MGAEVHSAAKGQMSQAVAKALADSLCALNTQDSVIVNLVKPYNVRVVLNSKLCDAEGEV